MTDFSSGSKIRAMREALNLNQTDFWARAGMTQSVGGCYERNDQPISKSAVLLLTFAYGTQNECDTLLKRLRGAVSQQDNTRMDFSDIRKTRKAHNLTPADFWGKVCLSAWSGLKYEMGYRAIPKPATLLLTLAYGTEKEVNALLKKIRTHEVKPNKGKPGRPRKHPPVNE